MAALADLPALHRLIESAYRGDTARRGWTYEADLLGGQRTDEDDLTDIMADPARAFVVAETSDGIVGCVMIADRGGGTAYFGMLSVDPDRQASGLGRRLLAEAELEVARRFGATRMEMRIINHRPELEAWYERRGYSLNGREEPFPMDDPRFGLPKRRDLKFQVMEKALSA